jgi:hypothetical protein
MISFGKIFKQSWHILWSYRVLWLFGFLLAITVGSGNNPLRYEISSSDYPSTPSRINTPQWMDDITQWSEENIEPLVQYPEEHITDYILIAIALFLFFFAVSLILAFIRYPAETAVMRMVDEYEQTGNKLGFRKGWRLGWSRRAFRMFIIDLILGLPVFLTVCLLLGIGLVTYFIATNSVRTISIVSIVAAVGLAFLGLFILIILMVLLSLLRNFIVRAAALDGLGVRESFRYGWAMFKGNWKSAGLMWLVMIGVGIAFSIVASVLFFLLIPAYLILLVPAGLVALIPGAIALGVSSLFTSSPVTWIIAILVALPFFCLVLFVPLFLISGWSKIYESNVWTLTYREIKALASLSMPASAPENGSLSPLL